MATGESAHRRDIQGMRAIAVLLVIASHVGVPFLDAGYVGVDVFFVLSGFLITGILVRRAERDGSVGILDFYAGRARRILPAAAVVLVTTLLVAQHFLTYTRALAETRSALWVAFFAGNWHFALLDTDYFAQDQPPSALQHYWSLAVEEQFYLVWPLLILLVVAVLRAGRGRWSTRQGLGVLFGTVVAVSLAWSVVETATQPDFAYFSSLTRAWELGAGGLLALVGSSAARVAGRWRPVLGWSGLAVIVLAACTYDDTTPFPGYAALLPVLGAVAVLVAGQDAGSGGAARLLGLGPLTWIGDISYSLYLWHWPVLVLAPAVVGRPIGVRGNLVLMVGAVALSAITYYLVEQPVRRHLGPRSRRTRALVLWPVTIAVLVAATLGVQQRLQADQEDERAVADRAYAAGIADVERSLDGPVTPVRLAVAASRAGLPVPSFRPSLATLEQDDDYVPDREPGACVDDVGEESHEVCELGDPEGTRTIVLLGDSTQAMWLPAMSRAAREHHWSLRPIIKYECPGFDELHLRDGKPLTECADWRAWAYDEVEKLQPDLLLVGGYSRLNSVVEDEGSSTPVTRTRAAEIYGQGAEDSLRALSAPGRRVAALAMQPIARPKPTDCLGRSGVTLRTCSYKQDEPTSRRVNTAVRAAAESTGVPFVSWQDWTCFDGLCPMVVDRVATLRDQHHLTATYAASLGDEMGTSLSGLLAS